MVAVIERNCNRTNNAVAIASHEIKCIVLAVEWAAPLVHIFSYQWKAYSIHNFETGLANAKFRKRHCDASFALETFHIIIVLKDKAIDNLVELLIVTEHSAAFLHTLLTVFALQN